MYSSRHFSSDAIVRQIHLVITGLRYFRIISRLIAHFGGCNRPYRWHEEDVAKITTSDTRFVNMAESLDIRIAKIIASCMLGTRIWTNRNHAPGYDCPGEHVICSTRSDHWVNEID